MTISGVLALVDELKPNTMSTAAKISFISEIEGKIHTEILMRHEHEAGDETMPTYDGDTDPATELLVAEPYHMIYVYWLLCKLDEQYREWDEFNNHRALFDTAYKEFAEHWTSTHMPIQPAPFYIL